MTISARFQSLLACTLAALVGCGSDEHPDSGYGANQPVPTTLTCNAICDRLVDCTVQLCNENTSSENYEILREELVAQCELGCTDADVQSGFTPMEWSCTFTDTCREMLDHDSCMTGTYYTCD